MRFTSDNPERRALMRACELRERGWLHNIVGRLLAKLKRKRKTYKRDNCETCGCMVDLGRYDPMEHDSNYVCSQDRRAR